MNQTKTIALFLCIELLESFSKKELQKFNQFVNSPYFNTDIRLINLFNTLKKEVLHKPFTDEQHAKVYKKVFERKRIKELNEIEKKSLRTKLSKLNQLAQQFLVIESIRENQNSFNDHLLKCLLDKRNFNAFNTLLKREKKRLAAKQRKETDDFEHLYRVEVHYVEYLFLSGSLYKKSQYQFNDVIGKLDIQYLIKKLSLFMAFFSNKLVKSNQSIDSTTLSVTNDLLKLPRYTIEPYLNILNATNNFLQEFSIKSYHNILFLINKYGNSIPLADLKGIYIVILNYLYREIKKGNIDCEKDLVKLYISMDDRNLLLEENLMPVIKLKNITHGMCKNNYLDKAIYFIEKYTPFVRKEDRKSVNSFCLAIVYFYQKDYEKALDHCIQMTSVNQTLETNYRTLVMKIYYERDQSYSEKTERFYRSAEKFFNDNKSLSVLNKKSYKNFTQILINLYRFKHKEGRMTIEKLETKLEQQDYNIDKKWLLEKIQELKNN